MTKHLWEVDHPYYCSESNYYKAGLCDHHKTLASFIEEFGDSDMDLNLVFRFDWKEGEDSGAIEYNGDDYYRNGLLQIFFMGQRKGLYFCHEIEVCRADEPAVLAFLQPRFEKMLQLWEPFSVSAIKGPTP
jgi:hypothetical protein